MGSGEVDMEMKGKGNFSDVENGFY